MSEFKKINGNLNYFFWQQNVKILLFYIVWKKKGRPEDALWEETPQSAAGALLCFKVGHLEVDKWRRGQDYFVQCLFKFAALSRLHRADYRGLELFFIE